MPRKQRIEYAGAVYHIISRENYRKDLFADAKTAEVFEKATFSFQVPRPEADTSLAVFIEGGRVHPSLLGDVGRVPRSLESGVA
ncbi:MAG: hypothetical protein O7C75_14305 [Verrucomicrobia bacterium]|nr:hypothetical protein [Verrucomicrobiota bacterium]